MIEAQQTKEIAGVFEDAQRASAAVHALLREHFGDCEDLSVVAAEGDQQHRVAIVETFPTYRLAATGAAAGAVLVALAVAIAGLDFGPFTLTPWGPVWAAFEGGWIGGFVGLALGSLMSIEPADPELDFHGVDLRNATLKVGLKATGARAERALEILVDAGARHLRERAPEASDPHHLPPMAA